MKSGFHVMTIAILLWLSFVYGQDSATVKEIVQKIDELYRSESSYAEMEMEIITPHWQRTLRMKVWTEGMKKTFIRILEPQKERGVGTLRIGNEMWNYLPRTSKVIKVPPSMMMSSWMGSDFTNDDLVDEFSLLTDYTYDLVEPEDAKEGYLYVKCVPKPDRPIIWGHILMQVRQNDYIPVRDEYYDEKGKLMRVMNFRDIKVFDGRKIPSVMELIPQDEKGKKTVLTYLDAKFNIPINESVFSLRNLRSWN
jgi:outer membrane lipoprotein-sorting protein